MVKQSMASGALGSTPHARASVVGAPEGSIEAVVNRFRAAEANIATAGRIIFNVATLASVAPVCVPDMLAPFESMNQRISSFCCSSR